MTSDSYPPVLDACCGSRMMWFDREDGRALFLDNRRETHVIDIGTPGTKGRKPIIVDPDVLADFTNLPFPENTFSLVVFDPPHIEREKAKGILTKKYGHLCGDWKKMLAEGFQECFRVLREELRSGTAMWTYVNENNYVDENESELPFEYLVGKTLVGANADEHAIVFYCYDDNTFALTHMQDCCESVLVYDIKGDLSSLINTPIILAEKTVERTNWPDDVPEREDIWSWTWTMFRLATDKSEVIIRWLGESNGYYNEDVYFGRTHKHLPLPKSVVDTFKLDLPVHPCSG